jgi:signal peptidase
MQLLGSFKTEYSWYVIVALIPAVYAFTGFVLPRILEGIPFYLAYSLTWLLLAVTTLKISNLKNVKLWKPGSSFTTMAATIAVTQIVTLVFAGIILGFGKSPYSFTPLSLVLNITFFMSTLLGIELSRAYIIKTCCQRKPTLALGLIALFYATITISLSRFLFLDLSPLGLAEFSASVFLPALAESLFATYLTFLSGPTSAITYRGILQGFEWLSPILPNLSWSVNALIGVMIPTVGFLTIHQSTIPRYIRKHGTLVKVKKSSTLGWIAVAMISVLAIWGSTGMLGFRPSIISSGSMTPTLQVGDVIITVEASPNDIKIGDIIQYSGENEIIAHRVVDIQQEGGTQYFITKGDDNNAPDPEPVSPSQVIGKLIFTIPKLGWISIAIKTFFTEIITFFTTNLAYAFTTFGIILSASIFRVHKYRNQPLRKLRRRLGR